MLLDEPRYAFVQENVDKAPTQQGVYLLYEGNTLIYVGRASGFGVSLNSRLNSHLRGHEDPPSKKVTHYQRKVTTDPAKLEKEILLKCKQAYGRIPKTNFAVS